jgi:hypothetical protein
MRSSLQFAFVALAALSAAPALAETAYTPVETQYIAALGDPAAVSGTGAETWGFWPVDPGPRGVKLSAYDKLVAAGGIAPNGWQFDAQSWWLEEHGLIMEQPEFPLPPGRYVVTGGREATVVLTIGTPDANGAQSWALDEGATIHDVTHLRCRAAHYAPEAEGASCAPDAANRTMFPVAPGATMPAVAGCQQQDYQVLIVIGRITCD